MEYIPNGVKTEIRLITPDEAAEFLERNTHNRSLDRHRVAGFERDMVNGEFRSLAEPIKIAYDGTLLDAQHRLTAQVNVDMTFEYIVVTGLPYEAQQFMDGGRVRKFADDLRIEQVPYSTLVASVTRKLHIWNGGGHSDTALNLITKPELARTYEEFHDEIVASAPVGLRAGAALKMTHSMMSLGFILFNRLDPDDTRFFFDRLADGGGLPTGHPILLLRNTAMRWTGPRGKNPQPRPWPQFAYTVKAWNAYREGTLLSLLRYKAGGAKPENFPVPR